MFNTYTSINDYSCQLEGRDLEFARWSKDENMAYCEGFAALCAENKSSKIASFITAILTLILK